MGTIVAPGTRYESELWFDRTAVMTAEGVSQVSVVYAILTSAEGREEFERTVQLAGLKAVPEQAFYRTTWVQLDEYLKVIHVAILILSVAAIAAATNALQISLHSRLRDFAMLRVIGFKKGGLATLLLAESILMTVAAGSIGLSVALAMNGHSIPYRELSLVLETRVSISVLLAGILLTVFVGCAGAMVSIVQTLRLETSHSATDLR
jgi:putative ABC transport system permease protein